MSVVKFESSWPSLELLAITSRTIRANLCASGAGFMRARTVMLCGRRPRLEIRTVLPVKAVVLPTGATASNLVLARPAFCGR